MGVGNRFAYGNVSLGLFKKLLAESGSGLLVAEYAIIYRPGGVPSGNVVNSWTAVQAFIAAHNGACLVYVDDSIISPALVPGASGITDGMGRVELRPAIEDPIVSAVLQVEPGATLRNLYSVSGMELRLNAQTATPSLDFVDAPNGGFFYCMNEATLSNASTATRAGIVIPDGKSFGLQLQEQSIIALNAPSVPLIHTATAAASMAVTTLQAGATDTLQSVPDGFADGAGGVSLLYDVTSANAFPRRGPEGSRATPRLPGATGGYLSTLLNGDERIIDFVSDCGADPSGVEDCAAAFDRAFVLLSALSADTRVPNRSQTLFFPPGVYVLRSAPATPIWNFTGLGTSVTLQGSGDASIIQFEGFSGPTIANAYRIYMRDLTCAGSVTLPAFTIDCAECFQLNTTEVGAVERCKFFNLFVSSSCLQLSGQLWAVRDCVFSENACSAEATAFGAVLWAPAAQGVEIENCYFEDISRLNGYAPSYNKAAANRIWFRFDGLGAGSVEQNTIVKVKGCVFDEACTYAVFVKKQAAGARIHFVHVEGCYFNPPIHYTGSFLGPTACVRVEGVDILDVDGMIDSGFTITAPGPALDLVDVQSTRVRGLLVNNAAQSDYVTADAACGRVRIEGSPSLIASNVQSKAAVTELPDQLSQGTAASGGGTFVVTVPILASTAARLEAEVLLSAGSPLSTSGRLKAKCVVKNVGGAAAFGAPAAGSANPINSNTAAFLAGDPQISDAGFTGIGPATAAWTVAGQNAVLTVTNPGATTASVAARVDETIYGLL
jgi:hypothetical protein